MLVQRVWQCLEEGAFIIVMYYLVFLSNPITSLSRQSRAPAAIYPLYLFSWAKILYLSAGLCLSCAWAGWEQGDKWEQQPHV